MKDIGTVFGVQSESVMRTFRFVWLSVLYNHVPGSWLNNRYYSNNEAYSYFHMLLPGRARKMHHVTSTLIELGSSYTDYVDKVKAHWTQGTYFSDSNFQQLCL